MAITTHVMGINAQTLAETDPETADYFVVTEVEYDEYGEYEDHTPGHGQYPTYAVARAVLRAPSHVRVENATDLDGNPLPGYFLTLGPALGDAEYAPTDTELVERLRSLR